MDNNNNMEFHAFELDDELNEDQKNDIRILISLRSSEVIQEWMEAVGIRDVLYGMSLLEVAALKELDVITNGMEEFPEASKALQKVFS